MNDQHTSGVHFFGQRKHLSFKAIASVWQVVVVVGGVGVSEAVSPQRLTGVAEAVSCGQDLFLI